MARIPTYISDGGIGGALPEGAGRVAITPEQMGAGVGAATQQFGQQLTATGVAVGQYANAYERKQEKLETANAVGKFSFDPTFSDLKTKAPADPKGFAQTTANAYDEQVDKYVNSLDASQSVRDNVKASLVSQRPSYVRQAVDFGDRLLDAKDKIDSNAAINQSQTDVRTNASIETFDQSLKKIHDVIDAQPGATDVQKVGQKQAATYGLSRQRFEGMIAGAKDDPLALEGVKKELQSDVWRSRMAGSDYDKLNDDIDRRMQSANSGEAAGARAALKTLAERHNAGEVIDPTELQIVSGQVAGANRPELMSQMGLINKQQEIYRNGKSLPLAQQRQERDKAQNAKGVAALKPVVREGITAGVQATNGTVSQEYLAGLVHIEYGGHLASENYGQPTGNKTPDGKRGSDAVGIAQFTSGTFLDTVRGTATRPSHAAELGLDPKMSDAELLEKRKDPVIAIKAAALHAKDNKEVLEGALGRRVEDGELYFAHFLGAAGAVRFLRAADANPKGLAKDNVGADQVAANHGMFFVDGRARTNFELRAYVSGELMNNLTRSDYAGVVAWNKIIGATEKGLRDDAMSYARTVQKFEDIGDLSSKTGRERRGVVAHQVAEYYDVSIKNFTPLTKSEVEQYGKRINDSTADEAITAMGEIAEIGGDMAQAAFKQLKEKDTVFGYAAGLATVAGQQGVAADILRGEKQIKNNKDVMTSIGAQESDIVAEFNKYVGKAVIGTEHGTQIRKAAVAHYVQAQLVTGSAKQGTFDTKLFKESIDKVLGTTIGSVNGADIMLPRGVTNDQFDKALTRMNEADYARLSKFATVPLYGDGKPVAAKDIANEGKFEAIGGGEYRIKMSDNNYLISGYAKLPDGSTRAVAFVFNGDPAAITEFANRSTNVQAPPPMVPGVIPARPRVAP